MSTRKTSPAAAFKRSPYAARFTLAERAKISKMPPDDNLPELAALRLPASRLLASADATPYIDQKLRLSRLAMHALTLASAVVIKRHSLSMSADPMQELWDAIDEANRLEGISDNL
jgi:hypothetical protein